MNGNGTVSGAIEPQFERVVAAFAGNFLNGEELGASIAVIKDGRMVVDIWGGFSDQDRTRVWHKDTITNVWSTTKTVVALAVLMLVDRGLVELDAPMKTYWPEFGQNGKDQITLRQVLSHTSGVPAWAQPIEIDDVFDWEKSTKRLAAQAPWWEAGSASGYHLLNYGHLLGEVLRRVTGISLKTFVATEIVQPLGADFTIGLPRDSYDRASNVIPPSTFDLDVSGVAKDSPMMRSLSGPPLSAEIAWTDGWRSADIGAANGHGNARSIARIQSVVSHGGEIDGVRLLSKKTLDMIFCEQSNGCDLVLGIPLRFGVGYALPLPLSHPTIPENRICFWGGWGGSIVINDSDHRMTIAYVMNKMGNGIIGSARSDDYIRAVYESLR